MGPDVQEVDYVAWVCDQDAYACSGQKCSAQSMLFMHEVWFGFDPFWFTSSLSLFLFNVSYFLSYRTGQKPLLFLN